MDSSPGQKIVSVVGRWPLAKAGGGFYDLFKISPSFLFCQASHLKNSFQILATCRSLHGVDIEIVRGICTT